ncbi:MAG: methyl-accepting chemotaxis sensory transducer [Deltaproteobacteria bacterium]|jgi:methyl-accepting chemotaxis protein|nr:methyl-accepting chemotaxis sensory transducer [Deltaproteobacteria bacterium]
MMSFLRFKHWGIFQKVMSISVILNVVMVVTSLFYLMPLVEKKLMEEKRDAAKDVLAIAYTLVEAYSHKVDTREMTMAEAQKNALTIIKQLRYRDNDYFWINDLEPKMLMHPNFPDLDGKNLANDMDPTGKHLFVEMVDVVTQSGEGFVSYMWPKPGQKQPVAKLSYVKLFKPWGWIVGSGIYVGDVQEEITRLKWHIIVATLISVFIVLIFTYFVAHRISELWKWLSYNPPE